jgi:phosphoglycolate phosphatase-like HAD superfamily hydrolase
LPTYRRIQDVFQTYYLGDRLWTEISGHEAPFVWEEPLMARETPLVSSEVLQQLGTAFPLGIATSRPRTEALMALRQHAMDRHFPAEALVAVEDAPREKPDPAPLLELVRRLGCTSPVYVGDTVNDAMAAFAAGMPFIAIGLTPLGNAEIDRRVEWRVGEVAEIVSLVEPLVRA